MLKKRFFILFVIVYAFTTPSYLLSFSDADWEKIHTYLLPDDHPIKPSLDALFSDSRPTASMSSLKQAGFKVIGKGKFSKTIVAKHSNIKGYILKCIPDNDPTNDVERLSDRIKGVGIARDIIAKYNFERWMKVPNKWIYILPPTSSSEKYPKKIVLIAEDMNILPKKKNYKKWKKEVTKEMLDALYLLLQEGGFHDMIYPFNMPFSKDGRIAFIDTEQFWGIVPFYKLNRYLSEEMSDYWQLVIERGIIMANNHENSDPLYSEIITKLQTPDGSLCDIPVVTAPADSTDAWYKEGLHFQCTECGQCCTGAPGYVWVTEEEMKDMADSLDISLDLFKRKYTRQKDNRFSLIEKKSGDQYDCVFLRDKKCLVYQARPVQCRTYPWWQENVRSEKSWKLASEHCEGINNQAPLVPHSQIVQLVRTNEENRQKSRGS